MAAVPLGGRWIGRLLLAGMAVVAEPVNAQAQREDALPLVAEGRAIVASRQTGLCVLCHPVPGVDARLAGNLAPPLDGIGARLDATALRDRVVDARRFNPNTVMPPFGVAAPAPADDPAQRVAAAWAGKPILAPAQIDAVVAYLSSLR